jgi:hypothetical protein
MKFYSTEVCIEKYNEFSLKVSRMITDLEDIISICECISNERDEECHPSYSGKEALEKLGITLAHIVSYKNEYEEELNKEVKNENQN